MLVKCHLLHEALLNVSSSYMQQDRTDPTPLCAHLVTSTHFCHTTCTLTSLLFSSPLRPPCITSAQMEVIHWGLDTLVPGAPATRPPQECRPGCTCGRACSRHRPGPTISAARTGQPGSAPVAHSREPPPLQGASTKLTRWQQEQNTLLLCPFSWGGLLTGRGAVVSEALES